MPYIPETGGSGYNVATTSYTRDGVTEHGQNVHITDPAGANNATVTAGGALRVANQGTATGTYSAAALTTLQTTAKYFSHVLVTGTLSTVSTTIYDNASAASGTQIGIIPAGTPIGTVLIFAMPVALGITVGGAAGNAAFTYVWST